MALEPRKQAACLTCRRSKIKCEREPRDIRCRRCDQLGVVCEIPEFHIGRQRGVKNKRSGLEKAIFQIEQAIKKSKGAPERAGAVQELGRLLEHVKTEGALSEDSGTDVPVSRTFDGIEDDEIPLDDAENPLNLLARASDLRLSASLPSSQQASPEDFRSPYGQYDDSGSTATSDVHYFFCPMKARNDVGRVNGMHTDPIDLGLITSDEATTLVAYFFDNLAHTRWGLARDVHTLHFMRSQSSFLLTSVLAASALFIDSAGPLSIRLQNHRNFLGERVVAKRFRSVEIVLAFMLNIPWMQAGKQAADDDTALNISLALGMALDLSLNKIIVPSKTFSPDLLHRTANVHCIDATKALKMDGFSSVDPASVEGQMLLRRRERAWLALFIVERGVCLARGRTFCLPFSPLLVNCDTWHQSDMPDEGDGPMVSIAVLRRDLDALFSFIRGRCDHFRITDVGAEVAKEIKAKINGFFDDWLVKWQPDIGGGPQKELPPYVEILLAHTRLSTYGSVINHPTAPLEVKKLFQTAGLSSALNVMRAAIQGEPRLRSMPNNTAIMVSFAAGVALNLSTPAQSGAVSLAPSVRSLIQEAADVLERVGNVTKHRNGMSIQYGRFLHELVRSAPMVPALPAHAATLANADHASTDTQNYAMQGTVTAAYRDTAMPALPQGFQGMAPPPLPTAAGSAAVTAGAPMQFQPGAGPDGQTNPDGAFDWAQQLQFSTMSGDEVVRAVQRAGNDFDMVLPDNPFGEVNTFAWDSWPLGQGFGF